MRAQLLTLQRPTTAQSHGYGHSKGASQLLLRRHHQQFSLHRVNWPEKNSRPCSLPPPWLCAPPPAELFDRRRQSPLLRTRTAASSASTTPDPSRLPGLHAQSPIESCLVSLASSNEAMLPPPTPTRLLARRMPRTTSPPALV